VSLNFIVPVDLRGENPPLRQAAKRWSEFYDDTTTYYHIDDFYDWLATKTVSYL